MVGGGERPGSSTTVPEFFVYGFAPFERKNESESGWTDKVFELTDGIGPDKVADFTSQEEILNTEIDLVRHDGVLYIQENLYNKNRVLKVDSYAAIAEKNLKITGIIDSRRIDRPGIIRVLRNKKVQRMWDVVVAHEFPMSEAKEALKVSASQRCGKILLYPHRH